MLSREPLKYSTYILSNVESFYICKRNVHSQTISRITVPKNTEQTQTRETQRERLLSDVNLFPPKTPYYKQCEYSVHFHYIPQITENVECTHCFVDRIYFIGAHVHALYVPIARTFKRHRTKQDDTLLESYVNRRPTHFNTFKPKSTNEMK
jgi:hypothetical protein